MFNHIQYARSDPAMNTLLSTGTREVKHVWLSPAYSTQMFSVGWCISAQYALVALQS